MLKLNFKLTSALLASLAAVAVAGWPVFYSQPITLGIDAYEYHGPLFGRHTQSQDVPGPRSLKSISAILVSLHRSTTVPDVEVTFTDATTNNILRTHTIPGASIADDAFASLELDPPLNHSQPIRITFSAPQATADTAVGIRFHPDNVYPEGQRLIDGQPAPGALAIALQKRMPLWRTLYDTAKNNIDKTTIIIKATLTAAAAAALASRLGWARRPPALRRRLEIFLLIALGGLTAISRWPALAYLGGVSGGDPYNYLFITDRLSKLQNPFEATKRLPAYPLLLLPAYLTSLDDILWTRRINIASSAGIVVITGLLARHLKLPWSIQFLAPFLLAWQKDSYWLSLRSEAYTLYALLLLAALLLFFYWHTWRQRLLFGVILGLAALTRQEGFVLAAVLCLAALSRSLHQHYRATPKKSWSGVLLPLTQAFAPALILVMPYFLHNALAFGHPFYTPYFAGERLDIVDSWAALKNAAGGTWGVIGSLWKTSWNQLERIPLSTPLFAASAIACLLWWGYHYNRWRRSTLAAAISYSGLSAALIILALLTYIYYTSGFAAAFTIISAAAVLISPLAVIGTLRWPGVLLVLVALTQILIATWFHPFPKHYLQNLPLITLALSILLIAPSSTKNSRRLAAATTYATVIFIFALSVLPLYESGRFHAHLDNANANNALDSVVYRAVNAARRLPGPYGLDEAHLPARLYLQSDSHYYENPDSSSPELEAVWLEHNAIQTLITTSLHSALNAPPAPWKEVARFKAATKDDTILESFVYTKEKQDMAW